MSSSLAALAAATTTKDPFADAPRYLTLTAAKAQWDKTNPAKTTLEVKGPDGSVVDTDSALPWGYERLRSFHAPSLTASSTAPKKTIKVVQTIEGGALSLPSSQDFEVIAPQFSLPAGDIHSVYPPEGGAAAAAVLPHIVFNDPYLPWERDVLDKDPEPEPTRNKTPWLALMAFTADELLLSPAELAPGTGLFKSAVKQSPTLAVNVQLSDITGIDPSKAKNCIPAASTGIDPTTTTDFIFVTPQAFNYYFASDPQTNPPKQTWPALTPYRFLAHSRAINTTGMANAGVQDDGLYSVIVSRRCGLWSNTTTTPIFVHLVSLDQVDTLTPWPMAGTDHVALCSLYSWTYQCLPPESVDIADALEHLALYKDVLGANSTIYNGLLKDPDPTKQRVAQRLMDGYTLNRYLLQDGEEAVSLYRGPLVPTSVPYPLTANFTTQSTFSTDLQILDRSLGIMDLSYSSAWQLGRTLSLADNSFFTALGRLRTAIHAAGLDQAKKSVIGDSRRSAVDVAASLPSTLDALKTLHKTHSPGSEPRWRRTKPPGVDLSLWSDAMQKSFGAAVGDVAASFAQSTDGSYYNELNAPVSSDWAVVLKWVLDRKFLFGVPAHYLISDPSYLPRESLRYFLIDRNWVEAMLDGALSLANHIEQDNDLVRQAIKKALTGFLTTVDPGIGFAPQVPVFGFLLRSDIVTQFPDLIVNIPWTTTDDPRAPLLRHEIIDDGVMLVLLDRIPGDAELKSMSFIQPPHQQRFAAGITVGIEPGLVPPVTIPTLEVEHSSIFTIPDPSVDLMKQSCGNNTTWVAGTTYDAPVFNFDSRMLYVNNFAQHIYTNLKAHMPSGDYTDDAATAAMLAIQLNDPCFSVEIDFPGTPPPASLSSSLNSAAPTDTSEKPAVGLQMVGLRNRSQVPEKYQAWLQANKVNLAPEVTDGSYMSDGPKGVKSAGHGCRVHPRPPHYPPDRQLRATAIPVKPKRGAAPTTTMATAKDGPAVQPKFTYGMWPVGSITDGTARPLVPTQSGVYQDLIVSVVLDPKSVGTWDLPLQEIRVRVPVGAVGHPPGRTNLLDRYTGPGPVMLSNLRFNVEAQFPTADDPDLGGPAMQLRIRPRRVDGAVPIALVDEMSILLPAVVVTPYPAGPVVFMDVYVDEIYTNDQTYTSMFTVYFDTGPPAA